MAITSPQPAANTPAQPAGAAAAKKLQTIVAGLGLAAGVGLFAWGFSQMRIGAPAAARPVEVQPVVETITGEVVPPAPSANPGQMTDEQARRREILEVRKFNALQSNP